MLISKSKPYLVHTNLLPETASSSNTIKPDIADSVHYLHIWHSEEILKMDPDQKLLYWFLVWTSNTGPFFTEFNLLFEPGFSAANNANKLYLSP